MGMTIINALYSEDRGSEGLNRLLIVRWQVAELGFGPR